MQVIDIGIIHSFVRGIFIVPIFIIETAELFYERFEELYYMLDREGYIDTFETVGYCIGAIVGVSSIILLIIALWIC